MDFKTTFIRKQIKKHENTPTLTQKNQINIHFKYAKCVKKQWINIRAGHDIHIVHTFT